MKVTKTMERWSPLVLLLAVLVLWQLVVAALGIAEFIFPSPWQIALQFIEFKGPLIEAAWKTFWVTMLGFAIAIVVGVMMGFLIGSSRLAYTAIYPLMVAFNAVPKAAVVPILVVWFGIGVGPGVLTAFLISFFPITLTSTSQRFAPSTRSTSSSSGSSVARPVAMLTVMGKKLMRNAVSTPGPTPMPNQTTRIGTTAALGTALKATISG